MTTDTFGRIIEGASGTLTFVSGRRIECHVTRVGDDYVLIEDATETKSTYAVPIVSILHFRYEGGD